MLRGFYTAASGMIAQQRNQHTISNNLANVNTPGYKADQATLRAFPDMLISHMESNRLPVDGNLQVTKGQQVGHINTGVYAQEVIQTFDQGPLRQTHMPTDIALVDGVLPDETGSLFFVAENADGEIKVTRNGHFTIDGQGYVTTNEGYYVLADNGQRIQTDGTSFQVSPEGLVETGMETIPLQIAYIADTNTLQKGEGNLFTLSEAAAMTNARDTAATFSVLQGTLEGSNVDASRSMSEMMIAYRAFEQNQQVLKAYDTSMEKAVNSIARLG